MKGKQFSKISKGILENALNVLRKQVGEGFVITPEDSSYDELRKSWNLTVDQAPQIIIVARDTSHIQKAVNFSKVHNLGVAIQATGHGARNAKDILILTSHMTKLKINKEKQTAWVQCGVKWGEVLEEAQKVGLAPLMGSSPDIGVVGYALGGGIGWLSRKFGLAVDSILGFLFVTADGNVRYVSQTENPDLFWAVRGGGGSFGIVTDIEMQLYPVTTVYAGSLFYPAEMAREVMTRYSQWVENAPEELTSSLKIIQIPPIHPGVSPVLLGKSWLIVQGCYCGTVEEGESLLAFWRGWKAPTIDLFLPMSFSHAAMISNDPKGPVPGINKGGMYLKKLDTETIDILIKFAIPNHNMNPVTLTEIRHIAGSQQKGLLRDNAFCYRDNKWVIHIIGMTPTTKILQALEAYIDQFTQALAPYVSQGLYPNFLEEKDIRKNLTSIYTPETLIRLKKIKQQYDPRNFFSLGLLLSHDTSSTNR